MSRGAKAGSSARDVGDRAEVVLCCLPAPEISVSVAEQLRASAACRALVEMSTVGRPTGRFGERADFTNIVRMFEEWAGLGENGLPRR